MKIILLLQKGLGIIISLCFSVAIYSNMLSTSFKNIHTLFWLLLIFFNYELHLHQVFQRESIIVFGAIFIFISSASLHSNLIILPNSVFLKFNCPIKSYEPH